MNFFSKHVHCRILIISIFFCGYCEAQDVLQTLEKAESLFRDKQYETAAIEYKRAGLFGDEEQKCEAFCGLGKIYFLTGDLERAVFFYEKALSYSHSDSLNNELNIAIGSCYLLEEQYQYAITNFLAIKETLSRHVAFQKWFYLGSSYFLDQKAEKSFCYFLKCVPCDTTAQAEIKQLFKANEKIKKRYKPKSTKIMSAFIPGLGQMWQGNVGDGLNSLLLNAAFTALTITTASTYTVFDAILAITTWHFRYYKGGITNAGLQAKQKFEKRKDKIYHSLLKVATKGNNCFTYQ